MRNYFVIGKMEKNPFKNDLLWSEHFQKKYLTIEISFLPGIFHIQFIWYNLIIVLLIEKEILCPMNLENKWIN